MYNLRPLRTVTSSTSEYAGLHSEDYSCDAEWHHRKFPDLSIPVFSSPSVDVTEEEGWLPATILGRCHGKPE